MDKGTGIAKGSKRCIRCNKFHDGDSICSACKIELINKFSSTIDWETALEMEKFEMRASRYILKNNED